MKNKLIFFIVFMMMNASFSHAKKMNSQSSTSLSAYEAAEKLKWELTAVAGGAVFLGLKSWNWGSSEHFKLHSEGWFGIDSGSGGADKLGHLYSTYLINEFFTKSLLGKTEHKEDAAKWAAIYSSGIMFVVEIFDGYSNDHGFSYEDLIMNTLGVGVSYLENTVPGLEEKIDLRVEYIPSYAPQSDHPITDYSGYKYIAALRLNGFEDFQDTPLKYLELHLGYHTEGFKEEERSHYAAKSSELYVAVSFNLTELLFKPARKHTDSPLVDYADTFTRYYQIPNTYIPFSIKERSVPYP